MIARGALVLTIVAACGEPAFHVRLSPIEFASNCGKPTTASVTLVNVIAYTGHGEFRHPGDEIDDLTADTEQLGIELLGGGTVLANGKTAPLDYNDLPDGTEIPIAVLPPDGFCAVSPMTTPRTQPLVTRAGAGALVFGGDDVSSAEYYDPATASFTPVALPEVVDSASLVGASIATLPDGRAVLSGSTVMLVFDPTTRAFLPPTVVEPRSEHVSYGVDANHVLVAGGCFLQGTSCDANGSPRPTTLTYEIDAAGRVVGDPVAGVPLPTTKRYNGQLFDIGLITDGTHRLVLADATPDLTTADRIAADAATNGDTVATMLPQTVMLDGGALLTAELDGAPPTPQTEFLAPEGAAPVPIAHAPSLDGARLALAEDGTVVAIGGDAQVAHYLPTTDTWSQEMPAGNGPGAIQAPVLTRLDDGTILVLGGTIAGAPTASAWLYRPSLVGPTSGQLTALQDGVLVLTATDASTATRPSGGGVKLTAPGDDLTARVVVGGPRLMTGTMTVVVNAAMGGIDLIAQQTGPARALVARLVPGAPAQIERHNGDTVTPLCTGTQVTSDTLGEMLALVVASDAVTASAGGTVLVRCDFSHDPISPERGLWGVAVVDEGVATVETLALGP